MLCVEHPSTCSAGEVINAREALFVCWQGQHGLPPLSLTEFGDGFIVANLVSLGHILAGNLRPLTAQLVTFWRFVAFSISAKLATIFSGCLELELFLGLIP